MLAYILSILNFYFMGNIVLAVFNGALLIIYVATGMTIVRRAKRKIYEETEKQAYKMEANGKSDEEIIEYIKEMDKLSPEHKMEEVSVRLHIISYLARNACKVLLVVGLVMRILN